MTPQTAPYGSWRSPLSAAAVAAAQAPVSRARFAAGEVLYSQRIPSEGGRVGVFTTAALHPGEARQLLPDGFSARSRVHEYGGGAWAAIGGVLVFVNASDQRLYRCDLTGGSTPTPLTPDTGAAVRYGNLEYSSGRLLGVRETHGDDGSISRTIVLIDPSQTDPDGPPAVLELAAATDFVAWPQLSPRGDWLAFIGWNHPNMPWDETQLYVRQLDWVDDMPVPIAQSVAIFDGGSILQPQWLSSTRVAVASDAGGRWELFSLSVPDFAARARGESGAMPAEAVPLLSDIGEIGGPLWTLGTRWYVPMRSGTRILAESRLGTSRLLWADARSGDGTDVVELHCDLDSFELADASGGTALLIGGGANRIDGLYAYDIAAQTTSAIALETELPVPAAYLPRPELRDFDGVHAIVYPPRNPDFTAPPGTAAPYVAFVHGGPTAQAVPEVSARHAYFTSRGIGVVDVNYGGSTGYGRAYRERLRGAWGDVDVADVVTVVEGLVAEGAADPGRLAISGGSAGGWTVLRALADTDVFACGASYYGVADLETMAAQTHDFESRYLDALVGGRELFGAASPLSRMADFTAPVAIFQGEIDPVVPPEQARRLIAALEERDVPYAAMFFPGESHGFTQPAAIAAALEAELSFYGRIMGFATPDVPPVRLRGRGR